MLLTHCLFARRLSMAPGVRAAPMPKALDLMGRLALISPRKQSSRQRSPQSCRVLDLRSQRPVGARATDVMQLLLGLQASAASTRFREWQGAPLIVVGADAAEQSLFCDANCVSAPRGLHRAAAMDVCEFCLLIQSMEGSFSDGCLASCHIPPDDTISVFLPAHLPIHDSLAGDSELADILSGASPLPIRDAVTGTEIAADARPQQRQISLCVSSIPYRPQAKESYFFAFPFFNRRLQLQPVPAASPSVPCCNCMACSLYCPADLHPSHLYHHLTRGEAADAEALGLEACIRCGWCSAVCPSGLSLADRIAAGQDEAEAVEDA